MSNVEDEKKYEILRKLFSLGYGATIVISSDYVYPYYDEFFEELMRVAGAENYSRLATIIHYVIATTCSVRYEYVAHVLSDKYGAFIAKCTLDSDTYNIVVSYEQEPNHIDYEIHVHESYDEALTDFKKVLKELLETLETMYNNTSDEEARFQIRQEIDRLVANIAMNGISLREI